MTSLWRHFVSDQSVKWSPEKKHLSCSMTTNHLEVEAQKPCLIGLHVPYIPKMKKRVCVLPIVNISNMGDQFTLHLWFHNDEKLEHEVSTVFYQVICLCMVTDLKESICLFMYVSFFWQTFLPMQSRLNTRLVTVGLFYRNPFWKSIRSGFSSQS